MEGQDSSYDDQAPPPASGGGVTTQSVSTHDVFTNSAAGDDYRAGPFILEDHEANNSHESDSSQPDNRSGGHRLSSRSLASSSNLYRWEEISVNMSSRVSSRGEGEGGSTSSNMTPPRGGLFSGLFTLPWKKKDTESSGVDDGVPSFYSPDTHTRTAAITDTNTGTKASPTPPPGFALRRSKEKRNLMDDKDSDESSDSSDGAGGFFAACCRRCPILWALLLLIIAAVITITIVLTIRRPIDQEEVVELEVGPTNAPSERLPTASPTKTPLLWACVCSEANNSGGPSNAASDIHYIGFQAYECAVHNHLTEQVAKTTDLTICVFTNEDADLGDYILADELDEFTMDLISQAGISYDLTQDDLFSMVQVDRDPSGTAMTITLKSPITDFSPLDEDFGGNLEICTSVPLVPQQEFVRPGSSEGGDGDLLSRPEVGQDDESSIQRPDDIQSALFSRPVVRSFHDDDQGKDRRRELSDETHASPGQDVEETLHSSRILNAIEKKFASFLRGLQQEVASPQQLEVEAADIGLQQPLPSPQADVEAADVCLSIPLGDSFQPGGSLPPSIVPQSGLQVCHCDTSNACIESPPMAVQAVQGIAEEDSELRICLSGPIADPEDISFLHIEGPSGDSKIIGPDEMSLELQPGGLTVITFPLEDMLEDPSQPSGAVTVSGLVISGDSEETFKLVVDFSADDESTPDFFEELSLSNVKEIGGCDCQMTRPTPSLAKKPLPPDFPPCPEGLVSFPRTNEITL